MDLSKVIIREMKDGEQKQVLQIGRRAFQLVEALFLGTPKKAMVAEEEGTLIGGILYQEFRSRGKRIVYIDEAFVEPKYHGLGVGKKLYTETFDQLWKQDCDCVTALVKDDNVGSWKLFRENGFQRVSIFQVIKEIGAVGFLQHYVKTPFWAAVGMDFYMCSRGERVQEKTNAPLQILTFFLANTLLLLPMWIRLLSKGFYDFLWSFLAYVTVLGIFLFCRYAGSVLGGNRGSFRFNNGGSFLPLLLSFFGSPFFMNANWYPDTYENSNQFRKTLAVPELLKWLVFMGLPFLCLTQHPYGQTIGGLSRIYLLFVMIPFYPFEVFGGGRIYRYSKGLWTAICILTMIEFGFFYISFA